MTTRPPLTLPAYTPTSWELILPGYPVMLNAFRSSSFPELLGSLPSESRWRLFFENMSDAEALALLLPWYASGCGLWSLTALPPELAGGVDSEAFRKRLTGTTWTMESEPRKEPVMKGRFNVTVNLIYELTFDSLYGPTTPLTGVDESPVRLNMSNIISIAGVPVALDPLLPALRGAGPVLAAILPDADLGPAALPVSLDPVLPAGRSSDADVSLALDSGLTVAAVSPTKA